MALPEGHKDWSDAADHVLMSYFCFVGKRLARRIMFTQESEELVEVMRALLVLRSLRGNKKDIEGVCVHVVFVNIYIHIYYQCTLS